MYKRKRYKSSLKIREGIQQPPNINPGVLNGKEKKRRKKN